jgi:polyhydroxyalkanoate synthase subunit PhaC
MMIHDTDPRDLPLKLWLARCTNGISPASVALAYADWWSHLLTSPARGADLANSATRKGLVLAQYAGTGWRGDCPLCVMPAPNDKRFTAPEWRAAPYNLFSQAFLLNQQWWQEATTNVGGVSRHHLDVVAFITRQWLDMCSPSNFLSGNPEVMKETAARAGGNLVDGARNLWRDAVAVLTDGPPRGIEEFEPGKGVATTPGQVVFRNELIELIQYEPSTDKVAAEPVLIIPSWIMKFYILDLTPDDSLVKYLVGRGHTVFMVSWRNPDGSQRDLGLNEYLSLGAFAAIDAVRRARPRAKVHAAGYCLGGTLLAIAAAVLGAAADNPLKTVSLLAAQTDFNQPGELGLFIDESQIAFLEAVMAERGYLDGRQMAGAFQLINSKDLVWSKLVHEYLMGAQSPMTAMKAWNADATRLPARMHSEYLRRLYMHNDLAEGRYMVKGEPVRLGHIKVPLFVVATERDHVSPWRSVYRIHELAHAPTTFVLSSGGHNVGIVNPPAGPLAHPVASFHRGSFPQGRAPADPQVWLEAAELVPGSWWPSWSSWLGAHSSGKLKVAQLKSGESPRESDRAPGRYVHAR